MISQRISEAIIRLSAVLVPLLVCIIFLACNHAGSTTDLLARFKMKSRQLPISHLTLSGEYDFKTLTPVDSVFWDSLSRFHVLAGSSTYNDCHNSLYYYGYAPVNDNYTALVFAESVCSCCGEDHLVVAIADKNGRLTDALVVADNINASECQMTRNTRIANILFTVAYKEECGILDGPDKGYTSIDSSTVFYKLTGTGKLEVIKKDSVKLVR